MSRPVISMSSQQTQLNQACLRACVVETLDAGQAAPAATPEATPDISMPVFV